MNTAEDGNLVFEQVSGEDRQIDQLYTLLGERRHSISHSESPSYESHRQFVLNNPYRAWYLVFRDTVAIGSVYVQSDNSIGLNLNRETVGDVAEVLNFVVDHCPLSDAVPSQVPPYFYVNVPFTNKDLQAVLQELGLAPLQVSYRVNPPKEA